MRMVTRHYRKKITTCQFCGREFEGYKIAKYCGPLCRELAKRVSRYSATLKYWYYLEPTDEEERRKNNPHVKGCIYPGCTSCKGCEWSARPDLYDGGCMIEQIDKMDPETMRRSLEIIKTKAQKAYLEERSKEDGSF